MFLFENFWKENWKTEKDGNPFKITEENLRLRKLTDMDLILFNVDYILIVTCLVLSTFSEKCDKPDLTVN